jgi:hypothetical protein
VSDSEGPGDADDHDAFPEFDAGTARRGLAGLLRGARERAGLTPDAAATGTGIAPAIVTGLESGLPRPRGQDVRALLDAYAAGDRQAISPQLREQADALIAEAVRATWQSSFTNSSGAVSREHVQRYVQAEAVALHISSYESDLIPGLLQTERYAAAVTELHFPECSAAERRELVETRLGRRATLRRNHAPPRVHVILGEAVLRRRLFAVDIMRDQFEELGASARSGPGNLTVQLCPPDAPGLGVLGGPFVLMRFDRGVAEDFVYLEGRGGAEVLEVDRDVRRYQVAFDELADRSIGGHAVVDAIAAAVARL